MYATWPQCGGPGPCMHNMGTCGGTCMAHADVTIDIAILLLGIAMQSIIMW